MFSRLWFISYSVPTFISTTFSSTPLTLLILDSTLHSDSFRICSLFSYMSCFSTSTYRFYNCRTGWDSPVRSPNLSELHLKKNQFLHFSPSKTTLNFHIYFVSHERNINILSLIINIKLYWKPNSSTNAKYLPRGCERFLSSLELL